MNQGDMRRAFKALDKELSTQVTLLIGGGSAILLAHHISLITHDIDGLLLQSELSPAELDAAVKRVARALKISPHWFNSYFNTFTYTLPQDYRKRLISVHQGKNLKALALGAEDLLIMKCFAGREKDIGHAKTLIQQNIDTEMVEDHLYALQEKGIPGADNAISFFEEVMEQLGR